MENSSEAALIPLMAFIGAMFGCIGCLAATLTDDAGFAVMAVTGTAWCAAIWNQYR
jgi:hypothetical protein